MRRRRRLGRHGNPTEQSLRSRCCLTADAAATTAAGVIRVGGVDLTMQNLTPGGFKQTVMEGGKKVKWRRNDKKKIGLKVAS